MYHGYLHLTASLSGDPRAHLLIGPISPGFHLQALSAKLCNMLQWFDLLGVRYNDFLLSISNYCVKCLPDCKSCKLSANGKFAECVITSCQSGYYKLNTTASYTTCMPCPNYCARCTGLGRLDCTACTPGSSMTSKGTCSQAVSSVRNSVENALTSTIAICIGGFLCLVLVVVLIVCTCKQQNNKVASRTKPLENVEVSSSLNHMNMHDEQESQFQDEFHPNGYQSTLVGDKKQRPNTSKNPSGAGFGASSHPPLPPSMIPMNPYPSQQTGYGPSSISSSPYPTAGGYQLPPRFG
jgi:preprotein translocase subunit SecG